MTNETPKPIIVRLPGRYFSLACTVFILLLVLFFAGATAFGFAAHGSKFGLAMLPFLAAMIGFLLYVGRDLRGKWNWRIVIGADAVDVDLPVYRSITQRLDAVQRHIPYSQFAAVETRLESYRSLGMSNMQRSFALRLRDGDRIVLGEDRALGTNMESSVLADATATICERGGLEVCDLGMAMGRPGFLTVLGVRPPPADAAPVDAEMAARLWRNARLTGAIGGIAALVALILAAVFG